MSKDDGRPKYDVPGQIELAQRKTSEARYAIAASSALILFVSRTSVSDTGYLMPIIFAATALIASSVYYWSSFEIEKGFRLIFIRDAVGFGLDGDEMVVEKDHRRRIWFLFDLSDWSQRISFFAFAISALSFAATGALFSINGGN